METWGQMKETHRQERYKLVAQFSRKTTQTEAAKQLNMSLQALNNFAKATAVASEPPLPIVVISPFLEIP